MTSSTAQAARGIFLGAAVGDALGWPQEVRGGLVGGQKERDRATPRAEFRSWTRHAGHYSSRYQDPVRAGEYSDDTQLFLATARSCLAGDRWWERLTEVELATWPLYQRGGGGAVLTAAGSWAGGRPPWRGDGPARAQAVEKRYRAAGANGVAMRIAPHVLWADDPNDLIRRVVHDGIATHGHPRALVGALVYAFALRHATSSRATHKFGDSVDAAAAGLVDVDRVLPTLPPDWGTPRDLELFAVTWQDTNKETSQLLSLVVDSLHRGAMSSPESTLERLGCADPKINGAGTVCAAAAIYLASRFAARPQGGLLSAAFLRKADTDTLASLTAAILGALHETHWLGNLAVEVQDADYIAAMADRSAARVADALPWPARRPSTLRCALRNTLLAHRDADGEFPDGRHYRIDESSLLDDGRMLRARIRLDDGQTALVDIPADSTANSRQAGRHTGDEPSRQPQPASARASGNIKLALTGRRSGSPVPTVEAPTAMAHSTGRETGTLLTTSNLARSAAFYAQLTGRNISVRTGTAEIAPGLLLRQSGSDAPSDLSAIVHITVDNVAAAKRRLGFDTAEDHAATIEVRDPDGRTIRISQQPADTRPRHDEQPSANAGWDPLVDQQLPLRWGAPGAWVPEAEVLDKADAIYRDDLPPLNVEPFSNWLSAALQRPHDTGDQDGRHPNARTTDEQREVYAGALFDLTQLAEELRYSTSVGAVYLIGVRDDVAAVKDQATSIAGGVAVPTVAHALLAPYMRPNPGPSQLISHPDQPIAGQRVLGGWWAAQLFDSALIRGLACLDRLAILLHCAAGKPLVRDRQTKELRLPAFRASYLQAVADTYDPTPWANLTALLDHEIFKLVKRYRDGFVHQRRISMELHGEYPDARDAAADRIRVLSPDQHLALVIAFHKLVLTPACVLAADLITPPATDPDAGAAASKN